MAIQKKVKVDSDCDQTLLYRKHLMGVKPWTEKEY